jgi:acyl-CoA synthetase (AMP-forming)/AMP-acid ligase II
LSLNPIARVLSSIRTHGVQGLLIGGQACILYGAAEFSRDLDFVLLLSPDNLDRFQALIAHLEAEVVAVPRSRRTTSSAVTSCVSAAGGTM